MGVCVLGDQSQTWFVKLGKVKRRSERGYDCYGLYFADLQKMYFSNELNKFEHCWAASI